MFSLGTDDAFAFSTAEASVMLAVGSPLPSFAATSTARRSFANWFERRASFAAFFRLIVAHFECPDTCQLPSDQRQERLVQRRLANELRMERGGEQPAL